MKKHRKGGQPGLNYWPGYVDAMTNVVLNLLFMVAMFGISLAVFNTVKRSSAELADIGRGSVTVPAPSAARTTAVVAVPRSRSNAAASLAPGDDRELPGDSGSAEAAALASRPGDGLIVADAYRRDGGPDARILRRATRDGRMLTIIEVPVGVDPLATLARPALAASLEQAAIAPASRLLLWTSADRRDPASRRSAFLLLAGARNLLIQNGHDRASITARIYAGGSSSGSARRIYIVQTGQDGASPTAAETASAR
jgi:hypothetical protein